MQNAIENLHTWRLLTKSVKLSSYKLM